jgi:hypothetical protein
MRGLDSVTEAIDHTEQNSVSIRENKAFVPDFGLAG